MMHPSALWHFYAARLRKHPVQELLAGLGIAIGVSLVFAVLVTNSSLTAAARKTAHDISGAAALQVSARDTRGFPQAFVPRIEHVEGVTRAAPILEQRAALVTPQGKRAELTIVSVDARVAQLSGVVTSDFGARGLQLAQGLVLPGPLARQLGLERTASEDDRRLIVELRGKAVPTRLAARLGPETIGSLADSIVAIAPLAYLQRIADLPNRVTRVLVETQPGQEQRVRTALERLTRGRMAVESTGADADLLEQATRPNDQATRFFALIAALVGLLLAFGAMLLTAPERRRVGAALRLQGFRRAQTASVLISQALALGLAASLVGLGAGYLLALSLFRQTPEWLAGAFPLGTQTIVTAGPLVVSFVGGVAATCVAAAPPLLDLRTSRARDAVYEAPGHPGYGLSDGVRRQLLVAGLGLVVATTATALLSPRAAIVAVASLAIATLLVIPATFSAVASISEELAGRFSILHTCSVAFMALRARTLTALALSATGAVAVFGAVAIGGARDDLLDGIGRFVHEHSDTAPIWIVNPNDNQATRDFKRGDLPERVAAVPGVIGVRSYFGGYLDFEGRRTWVIARSPDDRAMVPAAEVIAGDADVANRRLAGGGWVALSAPIADQLDVGVGDRVRLPTPTGPMAVRVAATTTNLAWSPGAVILSSVDYRRAWDTTDPSALEVDVDSSADIENVQTAISQALGPHSALRVQSASERVGQAVGQTRQGLQRLGQITTLLLVAAALAMAAAMGAAIWQRRPALAMLRRENFSPRQLRQVLLFEATLVLGTGCVVGATTGVFGQALIDRYLSLATGYSAPFDFDAWGVAKIAVCVTVAALAATAIPAYRASLTPRNVGLQE